jgi:SAM-dependent methyltransferase
LVREGNAGAIALYRKLHFFETERHDGFVTMLRRDWDGWQVPTAVEPIAAAWRSRSEVLYRASLACEIIRHVAHDVSVLDVGCGTGLFKAALILAGHTGLYTGVDTSEPMLERARARFPDEGWSFQRGDAYKLPFSDDSFDAAVAFEVLLHLPEIVTPVRELIRVAKTAFFTVMTGERRQEHFGGASFSLAPAGDELRAALAPYRYTAQPLSESVTLYCVKR